MASGNELDLERFVEAQGPIYEQALRELRGGRKRSHWMWFVFPQLEGLGFSAMSQKYAIGSKTEARAYLSHPVLGPRLNECVEAMLAHKDRSAHEILGSPDDMKFRSSMTLFAAVSEKGSPFERALEQFYAGERDERTIALLENQAAD
ncbi:DUF1810 domain-containing protein [Rhizobium sp. LCM 4573]|uniref:DUF1810 domain-containing protein n=1 Tax=Rhizobium sp. LCM 4573 TaxID=1848291 RepID=UPI0008DA8F3E|nr:DUF1810 domain-containing protein [Rhizobium sp. LCM 4573]OHV84570.1 calpastatin [Rhizobium sp. LCM 4573]